MAIAVHTGIPGSGKSLHGVKDIIVPGILAGRRVLSNIDGLNPQAVLAHCAERCEDLSQLGELVLFDGQDAKDEAFWPTEETQGTIQPGDLVVFDEWRLYFGARGKNWGPANLCKFLRWHRHLTHPETGVATDVHILTQLPTDLHPDIRGLCGLSYKYTKLTHLGVASGYTFKVWQGHLQPKGEHFLIGQGKYDPEYFPLYKSSNAAAGSHQEKKTSRKETIWGGWKAKAAIGVPVVLFIGGGFGLWSVFSGNEPEAQAAVTQMPGQPGSAGAAAGAMPARPVASSSFRIVGQIQGDDGTRVIVADDKGGVRVMRPDDFTFDLGRPVSGFVDGQLVVAEDRIPRSTGGVTGLPFGGR